MPNPTGMAIAKTAAQSAVGNPHFDYSEKDCQAWVEWCWAQNGCDKAYAGSNDMFRNACSWTGTVAEAKAQGMLKPGVLVFKRRAAQEGKTPQKYMASGFDMYHVGIYCDGIDGVEVGHSSRGGSQSGKLSAGWTHVGVCPFIDYASDLHEDAPGSVSDDTPVEKTPTQPEAQRVTVFAENGLPVKLRAKASRLEKLYWKIPSGEEVELVSDGETWVKVKWGRRVGFVASEYIARG